jgi:hypothetical protein
MQFFSATLAAFGSLFSAVDPLAIGYEMMRAQRSATRSTTRRPPAHEPKRT